MSLTFGQINYTFLDHISIMKNITT